MSSDGCLPTICYTPIDKIVRRATRIFDFVLAGVLHCRIGSRAGIKIFVISQNEILRRSIYDYGKAFRRLILIFIVDTNRADISVENLDGKRHSSGVVVIDGKIVSQILLAVEDSCCEVPITRVCYGVDRAEG